MYFIIYQKAQPLSAPPRPRVGGGGRRRSRDGGDADPGEDYTRRSKTIFFKKGARCIFLDLRSVVLLRRLPPGHRIHVARLGGLLRPDVPPGDALLRLGLGGRGLRQSQQEGLPQRWGSGEVLQGAGAFFDLQ